MAHKYRSFEANTEQIEVPIEDFSDVLGRESRDKIP